MQIMGKVQEGHVNIRKRQAVDSIVSLDVRAIKRLCFHPRAARGRARGRRRESINLSLYVKRSDISADGCQELRS